MAVITFTNKNASISGSLKTRFVEQIWVGLLPILGRDTMMQYLSEHDTQLWDISLIDRWVEEGKRPKIHTIREGNRWNVGQKFSPRVWTGLPRRTPQVQFAPDLEILDCLKFGLSNEMRYSLGDKQLSEDEIDLLAKNDGLTPAGFRKWFRKPVHGQVILWHPNPYSNV